jgi:hypothetical protein
MVIPGREDAVRAEAQRSRGISAARAPLASLKTWHEDPAEVERTAEEIKSRYARLFKV